MQVRGERSSGREGGESVCAIKRECGSERKSARVRDRQCASV